jgi:hypothetical protein
MGPPTWLPSSSVPDRADRLGVLGRHADKRRAPHPEEGAGPAEEDGRRHAGDVAGADGGGKRGHERVEGTDLTFLGAFLAALPEQGKAEADLADRHELQPGLQEESRAEDDDEPDDITQGFHDDPPLDRFPSAGLFPDCLPQPCSVDRFSLTLHRKRCKGPCKEPMHMKQI